MRLSEFAKGILSSYEAGDRRDYITDRISDPCIQIVQSLADMKAHRRELQSETSQCVAYRLKGEKIETLAADPLKLESLNSEIAALDMQLARNEAVLQALDSFFGPNNGDPTLVGLEKALANAKTGIERYQNSINRVVATYLAMGGWTMETIRNHPQVKGEIYYCEPKIASYKADQEILEARISQLEAILNSEA